MTKIITLILNNGILDIKITIPMDYYIRRRRYIFKLVERQKDKQEQQISRLSKKLDNLKKSYNIKNDFLKDK